MSVQKSVCINQHRKLSPLFVWADNWRIQILFGFSLAYSYMLGVWLLKYSIYVTAYNIGYPIPVTKYESINKFLEINWQEKVSVFRVMLTRPYGFMTDNNKCSVQRPIRILQFSYFCHHAFNPIEGNRGSLPQPIYSSISGFFNPALSIIINHHFFQSTGFIVKLQSTPE